MLKLFAFYGAETDWIAANTEDEARAVLKRHYGIDDEDLASYEEISEVDPATVEVYPEGWDGEGNPPTAATLMLAMTKPQLVCSTCH